MGGGPLPEPPEAADPGTAERRFLAALAAEERGDSEAAIGHYQAVLRLDPAHVEAISGLGRLRFVPPPQPFLDEVNRRAPVDVCEAMIEIRNPCNYRCFYCVAAGYNNEPVQRFNLPAIDKLYAQIASSLIMTQFECGGGEPTVHPEFPELVRICSSYGGVSFPSNNSQDPERWLPKETAHRLLIRSALHPESEQRLDRYLQNARYLIDAGCQFASIFIAHPTRMAKIPEYRDRFLQLGIPFVPSSFIGEFEGRSYPHAYTDEHKRQLGLDVEARSWLDKIQPHVTRIRNFRGIPCIAGYRSIYIKNDGTMRRCLYDPERVLQAPLQAPEPCGVGCCGCGLYLEKLNSIEDVQFHNGAAAIAGADPIPTDWFETWARDLGYVGSQEAIAAERAAMYDALMLAYGKDEFPEA